MKTCPHCGTGNREGVLFCEECGQPLAGQADGTETTRLDPEGPGTFQTRMTWGTARFGEGSSVLIRLRDVAEPIVIEPAEEMIIGRADPGALETPTIDLAPYGAAELGVSRRHGIMRRGEDTLTLIDLGSTNGTFLNGHRLIPHQPRVLRDGDEIRMGHLVFNIFFD